MASRLGARSLGLIRSSRATAFCADPNCPANASAEAPMRNAAFAQDEASLWRPAKKWACAIATCISSINGSTRLRRIA